MKPAKVIKLLLIVALVLSALLWVVLPGNSQAIGLQNSNAASISVPAQSSDYVGSEACKDCHEAQTKNFTHTVHAKLAAARTWKGKLTGCETCHGPGKAHIAEGDPTKIKNPAKMKPEQVNETCQTCHFQVNEHAQWRGSKHESAGLSCVSCHSSHHAQSVGNPAQLFANAQAETKLLRMRTEAETCYQCHGEMRKSQFQRSTHLFRNEDREMRVSCSACHEPHGSIGPRMMRTASINETCYTCHAEKRGPFLWEHSPTRENCLTCHKPHGSNNTNLLVARSPMLCQQCHIQGRHQTIPGAPSSGFTLSRACLNCHSQVHGSNHPSGINLQR